MQYCNKVPSHQGFTHMRVNTTRLQRGGLAQSQQFKLFLGHALQLGALLVEPEERLLHELDLEAGLSARTRASADRSEAAGEPEPLEATTPS